jgi:succinate dehydrogenase/fumarate reductase cytochrome b subunit
MLVIGIILAFVALAYLCWLLFALAVYALPFFAALSAGLAAYHSGSGPIGAIVVGVIAGAVTLLLGQVAFATVRSPLVRATVALVFAAPAALAGYHAALGLAHLAIQRDGEMQWRLPARSSWRRRPGYA